MRKEKEDMSEKSASQPRAASEVLSGHSLCKKFQFTIVRVFYDDRWNMYTNLNKNLRLLLSAIVFFLVISILDEKILPLISTITLVPVIL